MLAHGAASFALVLADTSGGAGNGAGKGNEGNATGQPGHAGGQRARLRQPQRLQKAVDLLDRPRRGEAGALVHGDKLHIRNEAHQFRFEFADHPRETQ